MRTSVRFRQDAYEEADLLQQEALETARRLYGDRHARVAEALSGLG